jgi:hypothetical protein
MALFPPAHVSALPQNVARLSFQTHSLDGRFRPLPLCPSCSLLSCLCCFLGGLRVSHLIHDICVNTSFPSLSFAFASLNALAHSASAAARGRHFLDLRMGRLKASISRRRFISRTFSGSHNPICPRVF